MQVEANNPKLNPLASEFVPSAEKCCPRRKRKKREKKSYAGVITRLIQAQQIQKPAAESTVPHGFVRLRPQDLRQRPRSPPPLQEEVRSKAVGLPPPPKPLPKPRIVTRVNRRRRQRWRQLLEARCEQREGIEIQEEPNERFSESDTESLTSTTSLTSISTSSDTCSDTSEYLESRLRAEISRGHLSSLNTFRKRWQGKHLSAEFLLEAAKAGDPDLVRRVLSLGKFSRLLPKSGTTPLHQAVGALETDTVYALLAGGIPCLNLDAQGRPPLFWLAFCREMCKDPRHLTTRVEAMLAKLSDQRLLGPMVSATDTLHKRRALHYLVEKVILKPTPQLLKVTACLARHCVPFNIALALDARGLTALHLAVQSGHRDLVIALLDGGTSTESSYKVRAQILILAARTDCVEALLGLGRFSAPVRNAVAYGDTPLTAALKQNALDSARYLIKNGASFLAEDARGYSALYVAIESAAKYHTDAPLAVLLGHDFFKSNDNKLLTEHQCTAVATSSLYDMALSTGAFEAAALLLLKNATGSSRKRQINIVSSFLDKRMIQVEDSYAQIWRDLFRRAQDQASSSVIPLGRVRAHSFVLRAHTERSHGFHLASEIPTTFSDNTIKNAIHYLYCGELNDNLPVSDLRELALLASHCRLNELRDDCLQLYSARVIWSQAKNLAEALNCECSQPVVRSRLAPYTVQKRQTTKPKRKHIFPQVMRPRKHSASAGVIGLRTLSGRIFPAHRDLLAAASTFFDAFFRWHSRAQRSAQLYSVEARAPVLDMMLHFIYHGSLPASFNNPQSWTLLLELVTAAHFYAVEALLLAAESKLATMINAKNFVSIWLTANTLRLVSCLHAARHFIFVPYNIDAITASSDFAELSTIGSQKGQSSPAHAVERSRSFVAAVLRASQEF